VCRGCRAANEEYPDLITFLACEGTGDPLFNITSVFMVALLIDGQPVGAPLDHAIGQADGAIPAEKQSNGPVNSMAKSEILAISASNPLCY
jgi:hypothetical protein